MPKQQPTLIKVGSKGAYINLNNVLSMGIVKGQPHSRLRDNYEGEPNKATPEDFLTFVADTASFYFQGRDELVLVVGEAISQDEFDNIQAIIEEITYHARIPVPDEAPKRA